MSIYTVLFWGMNFEYFWTYTCTCIATFLISLFLAKATCSVCCQHFFGSYVLMKMSPQPVKKQATTIQSKKCCITYTIHSLTSITPPFHHNNTHLVHPRVPWQRQPSGSMLSSPQSCSCHSARPLAPWSLQPVKQTQTAHRLVQMTSCFTIKNLKQEWLLAF